MRTNRPLPRRTDLRLMPAVLVAWPVLAFGGLVWPIPLVWGLAFGLLACIAVLVLVPVPGRRRAGIGRSTNRARQVALTGTILALLLACAAGQRALHEVGPIAQLAVERAVVEVTAIVAESPRPAKGHTPEGAAPSIRPAAGGWAVVLVDVEQVNARGRTTDIAGTPVLVTGEGLTEALRWRDRVTLVVRLTPADPGDKALAVARPIRAPLVLERAGGAFAAAEWQRARLREATAHVPPDAAGLVPALVIGDTSRTPTDLTEAMLATGMSHLSAVSGSNVTLVLGAAVGACGVFRVRRRARPWVAGTALVAFVVLARPEPSVIRAAVMGAVGLLGLVANRRAAGVPALAGAMAGLLVWDPWLSRSYGFALSALATLGLLLFAQSWGEAIARTLPRWLRWFGPALAVPLVAQLVCAPVVVPLQGSISLVAVVANLAAAPFVAPATIAGVATTLVSGVWPALASWVAWAAALPCLGIAGVARWANDGVAAGSVAWSPTAFGAIGLAVITMAVVWSWPRLSRFARSAPLVAVLLAGLVAARTVPPSLVTWPPPDWVIVMCDVGQGDALVLNAGRGHAVVVDAGPDPRLVDACLDRLHVTTVDVLVVSHLHADHVGGAAGVFDRRQVGEIRVTPLLEPPSEAATLATLASTMQVPERVLHLDDEFSVGAVRARVWAPQRRIDAGSVPNNSSLVLVAEVAGARILLTGDIEREAAAALVRRAQTDPDHWGRIDVLKVAHHGSSNRDDRLLDLVSGRLALVSVGRDNDYGHPAPSTVKALQDKGFRVMRTDADGAVAVVVRDGGIDAVSLGP